MHLVDRSGRAVTGIDDTVVIRLRGGPESRPLVERYAAKSRTNCTAGAHCDAGWIGAAHGGVAIFSGLPVQGNYGADVDAGHAFTSSSGQADVSAGQMKSLTVTLTRGADISGRVTYPGSGAPAAGVLVGAVDPVSGYINRRSTTKADGTYRLVGLVTGSYRIKFNISRFGRPKDGGAFAWTLTAPVTVHAETAHSAADDIRGRDSTLDAGHTLTVIDRVDPPHPHGGDVNLYIRGGPGNNAEEGFVDRVASGQLPAGDFYLMVVKYNQKRDDFLNYWYTGDGKPAEPGRKNAVPVNLTTDETVTIGRVG